MSYYPSDPVFLTQGEPLSLMNVLYRTRVARILADADNQVVSVIQHQPLKVVTAIEQRVIDGYVTTYSLTANQKSILERLRLPYTNAMEMGYLVTVLAALTPPVTPITSLLLDTFTTADGPGSRTRTADGTGQWEIIDTASKNVVAAGEMALTATTAFNATAVGKDNAAGGFTRAPGLALITKGRFAGLTGFLGWTKSLTLSDANLLHAYGYNTNPSLVMRSAATQLLPGGGAPTRTNTLWHSVLQSTGALIFWNYRLMWHDTQDNTATLYPVLTQLSTTGAANLDEVSVVQLSQFEAAWGVNRAKATTYRATSVASQVEVMDAFGLVRHSMLAATGITQNLWVRCSDASNGWIVRFDQAGSTVKIIELVAGVETERASAAQPQNNGTTYNWTVLCNGLSIKVFINAGLVTSWNQAISNITATGLMIDRAGTELYAWALDFTELAAFPRVKMILGVGDSKTFGTGDEVNTPGAEASGYPRYLVDLLGAGYGELMARNGTGGQTTATLATNIYTQLAAHYGKVDYICLNTSVNDISGAVPGTLPAEATWKANYTTILDALHYQFPNAVVGCALMWKASATGVDGFGAACNTLNGWVQDVVATRSSFAIVGPDERIILKGSDNGVSELADTLHPLNATYQAMAAAWRTTFGL